MSARNGIIIINKPTDWTSHDVVAKLRGILKTKRVGHGGTLDPMATGVLPIFIGRATRAAEFCENAEKEYITAIRFGITTDTQDITGTILKSCMAKITADELQAVIPLFLYEQKQIPPMYSAIKIGGKKLYELARRGIDIDRPPRDIYISEIELLTQAIQGREGSNALNEFALRIVCSKGTYIRTICHDIGEKLGCGAVMNRLERTRVGNFTLDEAVTLDEVQEAAEQDELDKIIIPTDTLFQNHPKITLNETNTKKCKNGVLCHVGEIRNGKYRVYSHAGEFLALGEVTNCRLKIIKSFFIPD